MMPRVVQKTIMTIETTTRVKSIAFCFVVFAHTLKWNRAGKVNAIGVHVSAPKIDKNLSSLSPKRMVRATVNATIIALLIFL